MQVVIAFDSRDARNDARMDSQLAHQLFIDGKLFLDLTNSYGDHTVYIPRIGYESEIKQKCQK